jgi:pimeloyl-ACP methyl ester carboxylesterase
VGSLLKDRYPSAERIKSVLIPTLVIAGEADSIVPVTQSREICEAAPGCEQLVTISGADHNDAALVSGPRVIEEVATFVAGATDG